jgi:hypothetical protein
MKLLGELLWSLNTSCPQRSKERMSEWSTSAAVLGLPDDDRRRRSPVRPDREGMPPNEPQRSAWRRPGLNQ